MQLIIAEKPSLARNIVAGIESGLDTVLVLSGVTTPGMIEEFPYRPRLVCNGIGDIAVLDH